MKLSLTAAVAAVAALTWVSVAPARSTHAALRVTGVRGAADVSSNWAGYAVSGTQPDGTASTFTSVSAQWVQPKARCAGATTFSAFWVGLGGSSDASTALEQIGTDSDCRGKRARYYAWYELVPAPSVPIALKVVPGNAMSASVVVDGTEVTLKISNLTRRTSFTRVLSMDAPDLTSAEWVAEAPSTCDFFGRCRTLPLANFGHVSFTRVTTTTSDGHTGTLTDPAWTATPIELIEDVSPLITYLTGASPHGAVPGTPSPDGASFRIDWARAVAPQPPP